MRFSQKLKIKILLNRDLFLGTAHMSFVSEIPFDKLKKKEIGNWNKNVDLTIFILQIYQESIWIEKSILQCINWKQSEIRSVYGFDCSLPRFFFSGRRENTHAKSIFRSRNGKKSKRSTMTHSYYVCVYVERSANERSLSAYTQIHHWDTEYLYMR